MTQARFDRVAGGFAARAGLPDHVCLAAAVRLASLAEAREGERVLDVGAGTGDVGLALAARVPGYVGMDVSEAMLDVFRSRASAPVELVTIEAGARWPVADGSARLVFGSRSLHLLDTNQLLDETLRVAVPRGVYLVAGTVERQRDALRERMRRRMRHALRDAGIEGRSGRKHRLAQALAERGIELVREPVATWEVTRRATDSLDAWTSLDGLDNTDVPRELKARVLARVRDETLAEEGTLERPETSVETYVLSFALLRPPSSY